MMLEEISGLYEAYVEEFHRLDKGRKPFAGAFGLRGGPQDYPCHDAFIQTLERKLKELAAQAPASGAAREVLRYVYRTAPVRWESESTVYWMLLAAHSLTMEWIGLLEPADAKALYDEYQDVYPRRKRLPVQDKVLAALKERSAAK